LNTVAFEKRFFVFQKYYRKPDNCIEWRAGRDGTEVVGLHMKIKLVLYLAWLRRSTATKMVVPVLASSLLANLSLAQPQGMPPGEMRNSESMRPDPLIFAARRWDLNQDGVFTCDEWKQFVGRIFTLADANNDGSLDVSEFEQLKRIEPFFADADMSYFDDNRDHRISRKEFTTKPNPFFLRYDINHDCRVTADEIKEAAGGRGKGDGRPGMGGGPPGMGGSPPDLGGGR
jgi:hypothetical protein